MDIQNSPEWVSELINSTEAVRSGQISNWEFIGNAFRLMLSSQGASIEDVVDESRPTEIIPMEDFRTAILAWCEKIS